MSTGKDIQEMERRGKQNLEGRGAELTYGFREREGDLGLGVNIVPGSHLFDSCCFSYSLFLLF